MSWRQKETQVFVMITENFWQIFWGTFWRHYLTPYKTPAIIFRQNLEIATTVQYMCICVDVTFCFPWCISLPKKIHPVVKLQCDFAATFFFLLCYFKNLYKSQWKRGKVEANLVCYTFIFKLYLHTWKKLLEIYLVRYSGKQKYQITDEFYSSNEIKKTQNDHLIIICQILICRESKVYFSFCGVFYCLVFDLEANGVS